MSIFIEHTAGWFPFWCAPEQVRILTVNDQVGEYVEKVRKVLSEIELNDPIENNRLRFSVDDSDDSLGKKIRRATQMKIPMLFIVGAKDAKEGIVSVRTKDVEEKIKLDELKDFIEKTK